MQQKKVNHKRWNSKLCSFWKVIFKSFKSHDPIPLNFTGFLSKFPNLNDHSHPCRVKSCGFFAGEESRETSLAASQTEQAVSCS
jgi:hypothetical protein